MDLEIRPATEADVPLILTFIRELADYERLSHEVVATEEAPVEEQGPGHLQRSLLNDWRRSATVSGG